MIRLLNNRAAYVVLRVVGFSLLAAFLLLWSDFSFPRLDRYHFLPERDQQESGPLSREEWAARQAAYLESGFRGKRVFLTPSEDGLICVPVVLLGINPVTALLGGAAFGLLHLGRFTYLECMGKAVIYALACYFVLPYGLLTVVAGHFMTDLLGLLLLKLIRRHLERRQASGQATPPS